MTDEEVLELLATGNAAREAARAAYGQAYTGATSDVARCWAAHMVAIEEDVPEEKMRWNMLSLEAADAATGDPRQSTLYPTVFGNIGLSHLWLAQPEEARCWYEKALQSVDVADLPRERLDRYRGAIDHMLSIINSAGRDAEVPAG